MKTYKDYLKFPKTKKNLGYELRKILDDYWTGNLDEKTTRELVLNYARTNDLLSENGKKINITVAIVVGKQRQKLIEKFLSDSQLSL